MTQLWIPFSTVFIPYSSESVQWRQHVTLGSQWIIACVIFRIHKFSHTIKYELWLVCANTEYITGNGIHTDVQGPISYTNIV